jgi:hypothetical protein
MKHSHSRGQALVEAIIAVGVLLVGFMGVFTLLSQSLGLNRVVADNYTATYLAMEGIEIVKNLIDSNAIATRPWTTGLSDGDYEIQYDSTSLGAAQNRNLSYDPNQKLFGYNGSKTTAFKRTVTLARVNANELRVTSKVDWTTRGGGTFTVNLEDHFYNWR